MPVAMLEFENVFFEFEKGKSILRDISFAIHDGDCIVIAGPNGSGKTVMMKHCNALLGPTSGVVKYRGKSLLQQKKTVRQKIGIVFQNSDTQFVGQTVREDIAFGPENLGWNKEHVDKAVAYSAKLLGLESVLDHYPHFLSGGEKKKTAIAGIIAMEPDCIILDEPFAGLDYAGVRAVTKEILLLKESGHTLIIITHDLEKVLAFATRLMVMNKGKIIYDGKPKIDELLFHENQIRIPHGNNRSIESCSWL